ncbi:MAG: PorV/PorQ family protein [Bacteroidales bacterium]|nr:PorV/PorQ family protein [Bacteroidales bacterium]
MKKIFIVLAASILGVSSLQAQSVNFLNIPSDPASLAMAGAAVARPADAYALENNMAGAALAPYKMDVAVGYAQWQPKVAGIQLLSGAGMYRISPKIAVGLLYKSFAYPAYDIISNDGRVRDSFKPSEMALAAGFAYAFTEGLSAGLTLRLLNSTLAADAKASAFGADLSLQYRQEGLRAGLAVCNIGTPVKYQSEAEAYTQPMLAKLGAAYSIAGFTASAEADYLFSGALMAGLGLEYCFADIVSLRGGFHYGDAAKAIPTYASLGLGVKFAGVHLDAAFLTASKTLGNTLMFSLGYAF